MEKGSSELLPPPAAVYAARARLGGQVRRTPLQRSGWLSERAGVDVWLKLECWQRTHSFKLRGALNAVALLDARQRARGLVTASAGNHGLAVARAARLRGDGAVVFVPANAPETKKGRIRREGAELREVDGIYDDAAAAARAHATETGAHYLHPFQDPAVRAGQATVGLEILEALPEVREVVVPVGGGGLAAGVGAVVRHMVPEARVHGVQSTATTAMHDAFEAGAVVPTRDAPTLCDGLAGETEPEAYRAVRAALHELHLVEEARIAPAIRDLFREEGIVAEGAGVVGVAALLDRVLPLAGPTAIIVSGGNIDARHLGPILSEA